jgi:soluble lytic murein transglycosylase-like protein
VAFVRSNAIRSVLLVVAVSAALFAAHAVRAEVIEIGANGAVTRFSGSAVYTSEGVRPISTPRLQAPHAAAAVPTAQVHEAITSAARRQSLSRDLLEAVAWRESGFRHTALSPKGAVGVMQIMPTTALGLGVDRYDLHQNIEGGAAYLRMMLNRYNGDTALALAAYNAGPGAVDRYRGVPPFAETRQYVGAILGRLAERAVGADSRPSGPSMMSKLQSFTPRASAVEETPVL